MNTMTTDFATLDQLFIATGDALPSPNTCAHSRPPATASSLSKSASYATSAFHGHLFAQSPPTDAPPRTNKNGAVPALWTVSIPSQSLHQSRSIAISVL